MVYYMAIWVPEVDVIGTAPNCETVIPIYDMIVFEE